MNSNDMFNLTNYNGLRIAAKAERLEIIYSIEKLVEVSETLNHSEPIHILGDGTNTVWGAPFISRTVLKMEIPGFEILDEDKSSALVRIGAGENWDKCVSRTIDLGLSGIEALSGIPGTAGAGPIQNIGAYGQEIGKCIEIVTVFDREIGEIKNLDKSMCEFSYRDSILKHGNKNLIVTSITMRLSKNRPTIPNYHDVIKHFEERKIQEASLQEIRETILNIRSRKLPNPDVIPNCGSFFKNPIVDQDKANKLKEKFPGIPQYPFENRVKLGAGWLIDSLGMKGQRFGGIEIYKNNALVLTAPTSNATTEDVLTARDYITKQVTLSFDIKLEMEPILAT